ncbi:MAG: N-acetylmannosamine-6-phosphate 2-epimerase [Vampirovibrio sp.]|nr:N-acetylmannosamine-6-phosphate 2-epimerase [Vampirovibrio sp.]
MSSSDSIHQIIDQLKGGIVVSVQADGGEPLNNPDTLTAMACSALDGGAVGIRMAQVENIRRFKAACPSIPVIGIIKPIKIPENAKELVYITPTWQDVAALCNAKCEIVAIDATSRPRPGSQKLAVIVAEARKNYPDVCLMADISTTQEAEGAEALGFDFISTTLSGYTIETSETAPEGPDFDLLKTLTSTLSTPIILEGRIWHPTEVCKAFELGAHAVVIGSAVTRPHHITRRFVEAAYH